jgi:hypothetical protein
MRFLLALPLSLLIASCGSGDWVEVRPQDGRFSIEMPAPPTETTQRVETAAGPIALRSWALDHRSFHYFVSFSDYPDAFLAASGPEAILDAASRGASATVASERVEESPISLGENPGRFLVLLDAPGERVLQIRLLLVGRRLYQFGIVTPKQDRSAAEVARFLDAFALLQG